MPGYWGVPTSSVDWCEANYEHTPYVCELFNTASSVAMIAAGVVGLCLHRRVLEARLLLAFFIVTVVGLGSIAFHGTLRFELQMLDELPLLYSAILMVYIFLENRPTRRFGPWFPWGLAGYAAFVTYLSAFTRGNLQFWLFQISFGTLEFFGLYRSYRIYKKHTLPAVRRLFQVGISLYAVAIALWLTDIRHCEALRRLPRLGIPNPQLHAWWHVLVSCGLYLLLVLIAYDREDTLGRRPVVRRWAGIVPYVARGGAEG